MADTTQHALPPGWVWTTIGEACKVVMGQSPPSDAYNSDGIGLPFYQGKAEFGDLFPTPEKWCSKPNKIAAAGDILISVRAPVGPTNFCREQSCIGRGLAAIQPINGIATSFIFFWLRASQQELEGKATGTTFAAISGDVLRRHYLPLAPLAEQRRIVTKIEELFTELDSGVAALKRAQATLRRYKASVLKAACEGRLVLQDPSDEPADALLQRILAERRAKWDADLRAKGKDPTKARYIELAPPDTRDLPELPRGWVWATLDQCFRVERGRFSVRPRNDPRYFGGQYRFVQIGDLPRDGGAIAAFSQTLNDNGFLVSKLFKVGTVLIAIVGATIANTGMLSFDSCCPDSLVALQSDSDIRLRFAEIYLRSIKMKLRGAAYASGGQPNINLALLLPYPIPLPPLAEQQRIVVEVERRLSLAAAAEAALKASLARAKRLRQAILRRAFAGQLVPQDPNDEPASALLQRLQTLIPLLEEQNFPL